MDQCNGSSSVCESAQRIKASLSLLQEYIAVDYHPQQSLSSKLGDKLITQLKKLDGEIGLLLEGLELDRNILGRIREDAFSSHFYGALMDSGTIMHLVFHWYQIIDCITANIDFSVSNGLNSITQSLSSTILPLLNPPSSSEGTRQSRTALQKRLFTAYERTLKHGELLCTVRGMVKKVLIDRVINAIPHACSRAQKEFSQELNENTDNSPRKSFSIAQQSASKLMKLFGKMLTPDTEEGANMDSYKPKINTLLRVLENYFYPPLAVGGNRRKGFQRGDIRSRLELGHIRKGFPISRLNMFHTEEIGGVLVGLLGARVAFRTGIWEGKSMGVMGSIGWRMKMLEKCLMIMWQRELEQVQKMNWLESGKRKVRWAVRKKSFQSKVQDDTREMQEETQGEDLGAEEVSVAKETSIKNYPSIISEKEELGDSHLKPNSTAEKVEAEVGVGEAATQKKNKKRRKRRSLKPIY